MMTVIITTAINTKIAGKEQKEGERKKKTKVVSKVK